MFQLKIITASTRPGRKGPSMAAWIQAKAIAHGAFDVEMLDLAAINLPFLDEPEHPRLKKYQHAHTKKWSASIEAADAFIMVTPEYNYGMPASLKNALDFLFWEWAKKPVGFVSYGGQSGGIRSVQMLKQVVTTLKMMPLPESIAIPFFSKHINEDGVFNAGETLDKNADELLKELASWAGALKTIRQQ
ncbi:MAG: NAD(P)H-dependent oxidoreductase [Chitinophagaceae bacterium]